MIRVMIVDDHPAMRAGLTTVLEQDPDLVPVGAAPGEFEALPLYEEARPDVVMLDFHLPGQSSLRLAAHLKSRVLPPRVVVYSAHAGPALALAAALVKADAVVSKESDARALLGAIRRVHEGELLLPPVHDLMMGASEHVPEEYLPMTAMLLHGSSVEDVARAQDLDPKTVQRQLERVLEALGPEPLAARSAR